MKKNIIRFNLLLILLTFCNLSLLANDSCELNYVPGEKPLTYLNRLDSEQNYLRLLKKTDGISHVKYLFEIKKDPTINSKGELFFQNTTRFDYHIKFLAGNVDRYKGMNDEIFNEFLFSKENKRLSSGAIIYLKCHKLKKITEKSFLGFTVVYRRIFNIEDVVRAYNKLTENIHFNEGKIVYIFDNLTDFLHNSRKLKKLGISSIPYKSVAMNADKQKAYHSAKSYGFLKPITKKDYFDGKYTSKDILIFDDVPLDIGPLAGIISKNPQIPNSHVILRSVNQNIPNLYLPKMSTEIKDNIGKLVEFDLLADGNFTMKNEFDDEFVEGELFKKAKKYWKERVPTNLSLPEPNIKESRLLFIRGDYDLISKNSAQAYGAKGTNFAILNKALKGNNARKVFKDAFLIPFKYYDKHIDTVIELELCEEAKEKCVKEGFTLWQPAYNLCKKLAEDKTIKDFLKIISEDADKLNLISNGPLRKSYLAFTRYLIRYSDLSKSTKTKIKNAIRDYNPKKRRMRLRSSTNAEDLPGVNGAGLYDSKAACLGDKKKNKTVCRNQEEKDRIQKTINYLINEEDPTLDQKIADLKEKLTKTKPLKKAIVKVYASLWNERAFLYRDYLGLDHMKVMMGILVHPSFINETANGVALIKKTKKGKLLEASLVSQIEDISITNPDRPHAVAEHVIITMDDKGKISKPRYLSNSNILPEEVETVLTPDQLSELMTELKIIYNSMEIIYGAGYSEEYDVEYKFDKSEDLLIKQIRPLKSNDLSVTPKMLIFAKNEPTDELTDELAFESPFPEVGQFTYNYHNHGWNSYSIKVGDYKLLIDSPEGDTVDPRRNTGPGWRAKMIYNLVRFEFKGKVLGELSAWPDQFDDIYAEGVSDYYCRIIPRMFNMKEVTFPIELEKIEKIFNANTSQSTLKDCNFSIRKPMEYESFSRKRFVPDTMCIINFNQNKRNLPKNIAVYSQHHYKEEGYGIGVNTWPNSEIEMCVDGKMIELNQQQLPR